MKFDVILDPDSSPQEVCELGLLAESLGYVTNLDRHCIQGIKVANEERL